MIDLHTHSTASDGALTPGELVSRAAARGLRALALTDHDTTAGCSEAAAAAQAVTARQGTELRFVPGVELEAAYPRHGTCHIVGLDIHVDAPELAALIRRSADERLQRNISLLSGLQKAGIPMESGSLPGGVARAGRLHMAKELIRRGVVATVQEAFARFLGPGAETYVAREAPSPEECFTAIRAAGGVAVIAHPTTLHLSWTRLTAYLTEWQSAGLEAIETYYPGAFRRTTEKLRRIAEKLGLGCSGGSDFHDDSRKLGAVFDREIPDRLMAVLDRVPDGPGRGEESGSG